MPALHSSQNVLIPWTLLNFLSAINNYCSLCSCIAQLLYVCEMSSLLNCICHGKRFVYRSDYFWTNYVTNHVELDLSSVSSETLCTCTYVLHRYTVCYCTVCKHSHWTDLYSILHITVNSTFSHYLKTKVFFFTSFFYDSSSYMKIMRMIPVLVIV